MKIQPADMIISGLFFIRVICQLTLVRDYGSKQNSYWFDLSSVHGKRWFYGQKLICAPAIHRNGPFHGQGWRREGGAARGRRLCSLPTTADWCVSLLQCRGCKIKSRHVATHSNYRASFRTPTATCPLSFLYQRHHRWMEPMRSKASRKFVNFTISKPQCKSHF